MVCGFASIAYSSNSTGRKLPVKGNFLLQSWHDFPEVGQLSPLFRVRGSRLGLVTQAFLMPIQFHALATLMLGNFGFAFLFNGSHRSGVFVRC